VSDGKPGAAAGPARRASRNPIRRLYDWVLGFAGRPTGPLALFLLAASEAVFFPIPPDVLLIPLCLGKPSRALRFALLCTAGSVGGALLGYWAGSTLYDTIGRPILELYGYGDVYRTVGELYRQNLIVALGSAGFTPIPYKVFTIAAGGFKVPLLSFVTVSAVSRGARFFLVAGLLKMFGEPVRDLIDRYFNVLTVALVALVIAGFVAVRWFLGGG